MCGICGVADFSLRVIERDVIHRMNETIQHRGPDDAGIYTAPGIGFGHRRLSIIDVAGGHQPLSNEEGTVWVLLNGEIYNYPALRAELLSHGHQFTTQSDTEAIVHLYEQYGEECFSQLWGMFAIAIWDSRNNKLLLARDRVGKKPLFYANQGGSVVFGSELKALLASQSVSDRTMDNEAVCDYFSFGYIPAPKTIYRTVRKIKPGHYIVFDKTGMREQQYWDVSFDQRVEKSEGEWCEEIRSILCDATRVRLMSEVPLGAFLSGGVDSSSVVAFMSRLMSHPVTTCSIGFRDREYDESGYARSIAELFKTDHYEEIVEPSAVDVFTKLAWHFDEPFADSSAIPTYYVSRIARKKVTVALGGDGGDENFAGYRRYYFDVRENIARNYLPGSLRRVVFGPLGRLYPALAWAPRIFRAKATFQSLARSPLEGYFNSVSTFRPTEKQDLLSGDLQATLHGYDSISVLQRHYDRANTDDLLSRIQYVDIKTYLTDDILAKVDRASMAVSLEVRAPFLDHRLIEMAARMPSRLKLQGTEGKYILKKAMAPTLPKNILYRKKWGFGIPLKRWFRNELKDLAHELIFSNSTDILNRRYLEKIWSEHQKGWFDRSAYLWSVLMFLKWKETFRA
jgi:asparagine synthase (glutamine-hydrolysing)